MFQKAKVMSRVGAVLAVLLAAAPTTHQLKFQPRTDVIYEVWTQMEQVTEMGKGKEKQTFSVKQGMGADITYEPAGPGGTYTAVIRYRRMTTDIPMPGGQSIRWDSDQKGGDMMSQAMGQLMAPLLGAEFRMKISERGEVIAVEGLDEIRRAVIAGIPAGIPGAREAMDESLRGVLSNDAFKSMANQFGVVFGEGPLRVGQRWRQDARLKYPFEMTARTTHRLKSVEGGTAVIEFTSHLASDRLAAPTRMGLMEYTYSLKGKVTGQSAIAVATGVPMRATAKATMKGTARMTAGGKMEKKPLNQQMTMTMSVTTRPKPPPPEKPKGKKPRTR